MSEPPSPPSGADLHQALRRATHGAHVRLNHHPLLAGLTRPGYSLDTYRQVLCRYAHGYAALEARILDWLGRHPGVFDYGPRRKLGWLEQDLAWFGDAPLAQAPAGAVCPRVDSLGELLGVLYPLEGATLGGQVISPHLERNLGLTPGAGARFFAAYGAGTPARWHEFLAFLGRHTADGEAGRRARQASCATFAYLECLLDGGVAGPGAAGKGLMPAGELG